MVRLLRGKRKTYLLPKTEMVVRAYWPNQKGHKPTIYKNFEDTAERKKLIRSLKTRGWIHIKEYRRLRR